MRALILAALLLAPIAAQAACNDNSTQMELTQCAGDALNQANAALNTTYQALMKKIDAPNQARLRDAQRAWVAFRDKECNFETGGGPDQGGTIWPMINAQCLTKLTEERTATLASELKCQSWDLSCPGG
jgi:uncharacterized protein YecT (DUF1311 family)